MIKGYRIGDYVGANQDNPVFGRVFESFMEQGWTIRLTDGTITGPWSEAVMWRDISAHVDYPHWPGTLYDCPACEAIMETEQDAPIQA